jgi:TonB family protein
MNGYETFSQWTGWFWPLFINHLWQATLFWVVAWAAATSLPRTSLRARSVIWSIALLKFALPVVLLFSLFGVRAPLWSRGLNGVESRVAATRVFFELLPPGEATPAPDGALGRNDFFSALSIFWWIGAVVFFARWAARRRRFRQQLSDGVYATAGRGFDAVQEAKGLLGVDRRISLLLSDRIGETGVWGIRRPIIVAPNGLFDHLDDQELRGLMLHELAHIQRRDNLLASIQMTACCLCWFHPLVWWIDRRLLAAREMLCDETVLRLGKSPESYIAGLCKTVQYGLGCSVRGVSRAAGSDLKRRIDYMASTNFTVNHSFLRRLVGFGTAAVIGTVALMIVLLFGDGARAQENSKGKVSDTNGVQEVINADAGVRPKIKSKENAQYTEQAIKNKVEGIVRLSVVFGADGEIREIQVIESLPDGLTDEAIKVAKKIEFEPALVDGRPANVRGTLEYSFSLTKAGPKDDQSTARTSRPKILYQEKAEYTEEAQEKGIEGVVQLSVVFGADGRIGKIEILKGLPGGLSEEAVAAARKIRFEPARKDGRTVDVTGTIEFTFSLQ